MKHAINIVYFCHIVLKQNIYLICLADKWHIHICWQTFKTAYTVRMRDLVQRKSTKSGA